MKSQCRFDAVLSGAAVERSQRAGSPGVVSRGCRSVPSGSGGFRRCGRMSGQSRDTTGLTKSRDTTGLTKRNK